MYICRTIEDDLRRLATQYPVLTITGPRQSGKTTLAKHVFAGKPYVSLENPDQRVFAANDPNGFLKNYPQGAILDEVQRVPELFSYIQGIVDNHQVPGEFILTGSAQFQLMESITQSLAGRTALLRLLPFSYEEIYSKENPDLDNLLFTGFYPRVHDMGLNPTEAYSFYFNTYIERDVRSLINVKDRNTFEVFVRLCAGRTGQVLNMNSLAKDVGVSSVTIKSWLAVLEASYLIHFLRPHHQNFRKRLVKSPKLYFLDPGLACFLIGIDQEKQLQTHPLRGALFETYVVAELLKGYYNHSRESRLYYFRDNNGNEVDILIDRGSETVPLEVKSAATVKEKLFSSLQFYYKLNPQAGKGTLVYGGENSHHRTSHDVVGFRDISQIRLT